MNTIRIFIGSVNYTNNVRFYHVYQDRTDLVGKSGGVVWRYLCSLTCTLPRAELTVTYLNPEYTNIKFPSHQGVHDISGIWEVEAEYANSNTNKYPRYIEVKYND